MQNSRQTDIKRIGMWAVPRSMATALLCAWQNRSDTVVWDEPLLPAYVQHYGDDLGFTREHLVNGNLETDYHKVIAQLTGPLPEGKTISYQKHQPHNLSIEITGLEWLQALHNCFLIRQPKDMLLSLHKLVPSFTLGQTGWPQLKQLFDHCRHSTGKTPPLIDSTDLQNNPRETLSLLCEAIGVTFSESMLEWPAKDVSVMEDNEKSWYETAWQATGFKPYKPKQTHLPESLRPIFEECDTIYQYLYQCRLKP